MPLARAPSRGRGRWGTLGRAWRAAAGASGRAQKPLELRAARRSGSGRRGQQLRTQGEARAAARGAARFASELAESTRQSRFSKSKFAGVRPHGAPLRRHGARPPQVQTPTPCTLPAHPSFPELDFECLTAHCPVVHVVVPHEAEEVPHNELSRATVAGQYKREKYISTR